VTSSCTDQDIGWTGPMWAAALGKPRKVGKWWPQQQKGSVEAKPGIEYSEANSSSS
jgi:hypothetical protein